MFKGLKDWYINWSFNNSITSYKNARFAWENSENCLEQNVIDLKAEYMMDCLNHLIKYGGEIKRDITQYKREKKELEELLS